MWAFYRKEYEKYVNDAIKKYLKDGEDFLDIGSNIGFHTISIGNFISSEKFSSKVHSFEPLFENSERIRTNINLNQLHEICIVNNFALSNKSGETKLILNSYDWLNNAETGNCSLATEERFDKGYKSVFCKIVTLDKYWENFKQKNKKIGVIKIDVEGHEHFCLKGAKNVLEHYRPVIIFEIAKHFYEERKINIDEYFDDLFPQNYFIFKYKNKKWHQIFSFYECRKMDDVLLVPQEKYKK